MTNHFFFTEAQYAHNWAALATKANPGITIKYYRMFHNHMLVVTPAVSSHSVGW